MSKKCNKCGEVKELTDFYKQTNAKDGHAYMCKVCTLAKSSAWYEANKERARLTRSSWYEANREKSIANNKAWRKAHPDRCKANSKAWNKANPEQNTIKKAERRAAVKQRTVEWSDLEAIEAIYAKARHLTKVTGVRHEVDHYYPLRGKLVSGLHVETNLQVITSLENKIKGTSLKQ